MLDLPSLREFSSRARRLALYLATGLCLAACGGGGGGGTSGGGSTPVTPAPVDPLLVQGNGDGFQTLMQAQAVNPAGGGGSGGGETPTSLTIHYRRTVGDYSGWQVHSWGAAKDPGWGLGHNASGSDSYGAIYEVPLAAATGEVGYLFHKGDDKDHGGADQKYTLKAGKNEIWRIQGDGATYTSNPLGAAAPDLTTVRVHYKRFDANYAAWGLHLWNGSGLDSARISGVAIEQWNAAVAFSKMPGYQAGTAELVFDIPVLNPKADASRKTLEFIIHGQAPNENDKDGRADNIRIDFGGLTIKNQVAEVWLVQQDATVYLAAPDTRSVSTTDARAYWLSKQLIQWPRVDAGGTVKLYHSTTGQVVAPKDGKVSGADGSITLDRFSGSVPVALAERFKYVAPGVVLSIKAADQAQLPDLLKKQLVLVQEDANGNVQNATTAQLAGALDDLYAAAANVTDLGVRIANGATSFKLWAPTAQAVLVFTYNSGTADAATVDKLAMDPATGVWSVTKAGDLSGKYYKFAVEAFVRGTGQVRNLVTDPYSLSLTDNSRRSYIANLDSAALKPAGWDQSTPPAKVAAGPDMTIYELHVRDFSANDATVSSANRGKYLAFTESSSNGMKHLKALADAGMTDVHLLPTFDLASVPETGCTTPSPSGAADAETQQATVSASAGGDCFNWGYDPYHYTAPEGSYASDASDGGKRILEFRQMVQALNAAGLRVGMDVVYNHTTASGQQPRSVLDRIVPGYYHRYNAAGALETSTCCDNTATENLMMGKLMVDSAIVWARDYHVSSFRFDIMGHQPRSVMEQLKTKVAAAAGRTVQLLGEGWDFGEVAGGARFVQASMWSLNGSGIGSFNPFIRDAVRGGSPFDSGNALIANQGWINGLWYDPNAQGAGKSKTDLMWQGDLIKAGLAGSIRSFAMKTHWDANLTLEQMNSAGFVTDPSEVVNYVENHDNQTLFDNNAYKLPLATSREDRARVQMLGAALTMFSQGVAYFHAGVDTLRSKSLDRNSYDSGDWFNRLDWSYADNNFGAGLPLKGDNQDSWAVMKPLLANAAIKPTATEIAWTRDAFRDLLKLRASSTLFRLRTADDIKARLSFLNTGASQLPTVLAARIDGNGYSGAGFKEIVYLVNADKQAQPLTVDALKGKAYQLHPVHLASSAADKRIAAEARFDVASGKFTVPARSALVWVLN
ncbi:alpha-1,6-glucosidase domain-containing protein [Pelomonas sp. SE-A7]|uniref:alpha-1,6-glucosidase domain-containing protein n=1 Tax=Pelomonas sp. SE-A7 TaxID=3054953 RepID=UPI00259CAA23|nr:alpha-1,6-glucosidase domain-containing protein [Pelomonas sp. SE-A7]MDM4767943.1 DUF3372 domain-containing protein [Pelomonas sp. SE-A7]